jgi:hypothetical protein
VAKRLVIGIDWFGPYTRKEVLKAISNFDGGLYLATGRRSGKGNHKKRPQYIGISTNGLCGRAGNPAHHKLNQLDASFKIWLGEIATAEPAGKRALATPTTLRFAEWLHVYFMELPLNERKKENLPPKPVTVLNRWWAKDFETPRLRRPHPAWPDLIDFAGREYRARKVWFQAPNQIVYPASDFN